MKFIKYFVLSTFLASALKAIDNPHFYRATYFWGEPRLERPWLSTFEFTFGGANTKNARNNNGEKTELLNIFGPHAMQRLGAGVPGLDPSNPLDLILINLAALPSRPGFGDLEFSGKFQIIEGQCIWYQNFINGFFAQAHLPIRKLKISRIRFQDLSPDDPVFPNRNTPEWQAFLSSFNAILDQFNLSLKGARAIGAGDLSLLIGWALNYIDTEFLDYVDIDAKIGVLFPTGRTKKENRPFDLPFGYNGFFGLPLKFDISTGAFDWLTVGVHVGALFFFNKTKNLRIKTDAAQNGFIKLAQTMITIDQGTIWDAATYIKADHVIKGLSILLGYTYSKKDADCLQPQEKGIFNPRIINQDNQFKSWRMHTFNLLIEYDFAKRAEDIGLRLGLLYNRVLAGQRIFNAHPKAVYAGIDIAWCF